MKTAKIVRAITTAAHSGIVLPVTYVAQTNTSKWTQDEVFLAARAADFNVQKRNGVWCEISKIE